MKLIKYFEKFLIDTVNLNKTRYDTATTGVGAITDFLKSNDTLKEYFVTTTPQGSYRQKTIIKPPSEKHEFDVDLLFEMKVVQGWEACDYINSIAQEFKTTDRYRNKVDTKGKSRCVTIDYESDFHIDIVPAIRTATELLIMNKNTNQFELTDGDGYATWFEGKNSIANGFLIEAIRLLKYIRDVKQRFTAKSVLLTTLLGNLVYYGDETRLYPDLPSALLEVVGRLDFYLEINPTMPTVTNPILPTESFNRHWDQSKYSEFRAAIHNLNARIKDAYAQQDEQASIKKWQLVFGEEFPESIETSKAFNAPITRDTGEEFLSDFGIRENIQYPLKINAKVNQNGFRPFNLLQSLNPLRKRLSLQFFVEQIGVPWPYVLKWKVKNYGEEAVAARDYRGKIIDDAGGAAIKENTKYRGKHYVECYAIKEAVCVAKDRIEVPIGNL